MNALRVEDLRFRSVDLAVRIPAILAACALFVVAAASASTCAVPFGEVGSRGQTVNVWFTAEDGVLDSVKEKLKQKLEAAAQKWNTPGCEGAHRFGTVAEGTSSRWADMQVRLLNSRPPGPKRGDYNWESRTMVFWARCPQDPTPGECSGQWLNFDVLGGHVAHEFGHEQGLDHDSCSDTSIMRVERPISSSDTIEKDHCSLVAQRNRAYDLTVSVTGIDASVGELAQAKIEIGHPEPYVTGGPAVELTVLLWMSLKSTTRSQVTAVL